MKGTRQLKHEENIKKDNLFSVVAFGCGRLNDYHILCSVKTGYNGNIGISVLRYNRRSTLAEECRQETQSCQHYEADDLPDSSRKARA